MSRTMQRQLNTLLSMKLESYARKAKTRAELTDLLKPETRNRIKFELTTEISAIIEELIEMRDLVNGLGPEPEQT